jgi:long-chain acyl-CoA synthetase
VEVAIAEDGEILSRGPHIMEGYFNQPEATAQAIDADGWFHTGDIGELRDGFLAITDRKKDIIVTAGGKNIAPQNLESDLKTSRFVSQAIVVGDRRPYPAALITLDPVELGKWAQEHGLDGDLRGLAREPRVVELVSGIVDDVNRGRSRYEQLKRFAILDRDFEPGRDEVTPTLKLRRRVVLEHFADVVEGLYDASTETQVSD